MITLAMIAVSNLLMLLTLLSIADVFPVKNRCICGQPKGTKEVEDLDINIA